MLILPEKEEILHPAWLKRTVFALAILLFAYQAGRAWMLSFTHDEAYTFTRYVRATLFELITYHLGPDRSYPNHHLLNTLIAKALYSLFGPHWFVLRFHALLEYAVYLWFSWKISSRMSPVFCIGTFLLLNTNQLVVDFFALCRGYAGAMAFLLAAVYQLTEYLSGDGRIKRFYLMGIFAALSILFHLSFLNFFVPFIGVVMVIILAENQTFRTKAARIAALLIPSIPALWWMLSIAFRFKGMGELDVSGLKGFITDTAGSIITYSTYGHRPPAVLIAMIVWVFAALLFSALVISFTRYIYDQKARMPVALGMALLLAAFTLNIYAQHWLLGNRFPSERWVMFYVPVAALFLAAFFYELPGRLQPYGRIVFSVITGLCVAVFLMTANCKTNLTWWYDANDKEAYGSLSKSGEHEAAIGASWLLEPSMNYYRILSKEYNVRNFNRSGVIFTDESGYYKPEDSSDLKSCIRIRKYLPSGNMLVKNPVKSLPLFDTMLRFPAGNTFVDVIRISKIPAGVPVAVTIRCKTSAPEYTHASLVVLATTNGRKVFYSEWPIQPAIIESGKLQDAWFSVIVPPLEEGSEIHVYPGQTDVGPAEIREFEVKAAKDSHVQRIFP